MSGPCRGPRQKPGSDRSAKGASRPRALPSSRTPGSLSSTIDRLKRYIGKCGVRKVWQRELAGLDGRQAVQRLEQILQSLGMVGRPTLEKCRAIKERREHEEDRAALDPRNVLSTRLRRGGPHQQTSHPQAGRPAAPDAPSGTGTQTIPTLAGRAGLADRINLAGLGDPEDE